MRSVCTTERPFKQAMLDFSKVITPPGHGDVLVLPDPKRCVEAAFANARALRECETLIARVPLSEWRRRTREAIVGASDGPVIVTGHQPAFIHPGVWAKHIVSSRMADAIGGVAVNLVVDSDAPAATTLAIPAVEDGGVALRTQPFADSPPGFSFEQFAKQSSSEMGALESFAQQALGARYDASQMSLFFRGFRGAVGAEDWVDQAVAGRRAVEKSLGVTVVDHRISRAWWSPILLDVVLHAERFARCYNESLAKYRRLYRVRGANRPIPDLRTSGASVELPVWVYRSGEARRRLFVLRERDGVRLLADREIIGSLSTGELTSCDRVVDTLAAHGGWRLRPRALTLTIWARLLLADLFIHGIGGAKYDRISDFVIADYYGVVPPQMACVSATLLMDLPRSEVSPERIRGLRSELRDLRYNPQRHLPTGEPDLTALIERRDASVHLSQQLRGRDRFNRTARRAAFAETRAVSAMMVAARPQAVEQKRRQLDSSVVRVRQNEIARGREYFFALYDRATLEVLLKALPTTERFRL